MTFGSPSAYFSGNQGVITRGPITGIQVEPFCNWISVIEYPHGWYVNYAHFNGFIHNFHTAFKTCEKCYTQMFLLKLSSQKTFLFPKFVIDTIN